MKRRLLNSDYQPLDLPAEIFVPLRSRKQVSVVKWGEDEETQLTRIRASNARLKAAKTFSKSPTNAFQSCPILEKLEPRKEVSKDDCNAAWEDWKRQKDEQARRKRDQAVRVNEKLAQSKSDNAVAWLEWKARKDAERKRQLDEHRAKQRQYEEIAERERLEKLERLKVLQEQERSRTQPAATTTSKAPKSKPKPVIKKQVAQVLLERIAASPYQEPLVNPLRQTEFEGGIGQLKPLNSLGGPRCSSAPSPKKRKKKKKRKQKKQAERSVSSSPKGGGTHTIPTQPRLQPLAVSTRERNSRLKLEVNFQVSPLACSPLASLQYSPFTQSEEGFHRSRQSTVPTPGGVMSLSADPEIAKQQIRENKKAVALREACNIAKQLDTEDLELLGHVNRPTPLLAKLMGAVCALLGEKATLKTAQEIFRKGLWFKEKLMMVDRLDPLLSNIHRVQTIILDPMFDAEQFERLSRCAGQLARWVEAMMTAHAPEPIEGDGTEENRDLQSSMCESTAVETVDADPSAEAEQPTEGKEETVDEAESSADPSAEQPAEEPVESKAVEPAAPVK